jgi:hypothetical protein
VSSWAPGGSVRRTAAGLSETEERKFQFDFQFADLIWKVLNVWRRFLLALLLSIVLSGGATLRTECSPTTNDYEAPARRNQLNSSEQLTLAWSNSNQMYVYFRRNTKTCNTHARAHRDLFSSAHRLHRCFLIFIYSSKQRRLTRTRKPEIDSNSTYDLNTN